jgi:hypothetical protein
MTAATQNIASPMAPLSPDPVIKNEDGYMKLTFQGKEDQLLQVVEYISKQKMLPQSVIAQEVDWFYK